MKRTIYPLLAACLLLGCTGARAAEYYVDSAGDDSASGLATNTAWRSIQTAVDRLQAGDTLWIRGGVYRGKVTYANTRGRADAPVRVLAYPGEDVVLKGSVIATGWESAGAGAWRLPGWNHNSQQVFADGVRLTQLGWPSAYVRDRACGCSSWMYMPVGYDCRSIGPAGMGFDIPDPTGAMPEGSFWYNAASGDLYVRLAGDADPGTRLMEVSKEDSVFFDVSKVGFLHLENLTFMHTSSLTTTAIGYPVVLLGPDSVIRNSSILEGDGIGLWLSSRSRAENCRIADHGVLGVAMNYATDWVIDGCEVSGANYRQMSLDYAGGMKLIPDCAGTVQNCVVRDNFATGIWFDTCNSGKPIIVRNNVVINTSPPTGRNLDVSAHCATGIFIEISSNAQVYGNLVSGTACVGIASSGSRNVRIFNNTVHNTSAVGSGGPRGHYALVVDRPSPGFPVEDVQAHNNLLVDNACDYDIIANRQDGYLMRQVRFDHNLIWRSTPGGSAFPSARAVFHYAGVGYSSLATWAAGTGFDAHSLSTPPLVDASFRPRAGSPLIDAGATDAIPVWLDPAGLRGTDGDGDGKAEPDIGAFEFAPDTTRILHVDDDASSPAPPYTNLTAAAATVADALAIARPGDVVLIRPGTYPVDAELVLNQPVVMRGAIDGPGRAILVATASNRVARLDAEGAVLENLVLRNGRAATGGCVRLDRGSLRDCLVENGSAARGGGVWAATGTLVTATTITGCSATESGGGIWLDPGATADSCTLASNTASVSGGGAHAGGGALLAATTLRQNQAPSGGGAFLAGGRAERCLFDRNTASSGGGGAHVSDAGGIEACRVIDNQGGW
jgi:parallel beta-helix repeat protein